MIHAFPWPVVLRDAPHGSGDNPETPLPRLHGPNADDGGGVKGKRSGSRKLPGMVSSGMHEILDDSYEKSVAHSYANDPFNSRKHPRSYAVNRLSLSLSHLAIPLSLASSPGPVLDRLSIVPTLDYRR